MEFVHYILVEPEINLQEEGIVHGNPVNYYHLQSVHFEMHNQTGTIKRMHAFSDLNI